MSSVMPMIQLMDKLYAVRKAEIGHRMLVCGSFDAHRKMWRLASTLNKLWDNDYELYRKMDCAVCDWTSYAEHWEAWRYRE